ncbi:MAG TPA: hypothetical protein VGC46_07275 [Allosphingosinicella sp.]
MSIYRLYCLKDGQVSAVDYLECDNDEAALAEARSRHPDDRCELWLGDRLVAALRGPEASG